jgi:hypothetical protein
VSAEDHKKVTFKVTERDVLRFVRFHLLHAPGSRLWTWGLYLAWILWPAYTAVTVDYELPPDHPLFRTMPLIAASITIPLCALTGVLFFWFMTWVNAKQWSRQTIGVIGEGTVEISPEAVSRTWETGESLQKWSAFQQIVGTPEFILFYQGQNFAQIIPRRAFASPEAAEAFLQSAQQWHQQHR